MWMQPGEMLCREESPPQITNPMVQPLRLPKSVEAGESITEEKAPELAGVGNRNESLRP